MLPGVEVLGPVRRRGSCNAAFVTRSRSGLGVLRLNADRDPGEFAKEAWCMARAAEVGVPVAAPLGHGRRGGLNWMLQSHVGDRDGRDLADPLPAWRFLGDAARRLGRIPVRGFGDEMAGAGAFVGDWGRHLGENLAALDHHPVVAALPRTHAALLGARLRALAARAFRIGLCHGDLHPRNVVLGASGPHLIDWGCAHAQVAPQFDLRELLRGHAPEAPEARAFADGLGPGVDAARLFREAESLLLLTSFDLCRWARDRAPDRLAAKTAELRRLLARIAARRS